MPETSTEIVVDVPAKELFDVVSDFKKYPEFLPDVKKVELETKGREIQGTFEIKVIKTIRYTLKFKMQPSKKISWSFVHGDLFKDNCGHWELEELGKGQTRAVYSINVDFGLFVPKAIISMLVGSNLPAMMQRFKKRAETLHNGKKRQGGS